MQKSRVVFTEEDVIVIPTSALKNPALDHAALILLGAIMRVANEDGRFEMKMAFIESALRISPERVETTIRSLNDVGAIDAEVRMNNGVVMGQVLTHVPRWYIPASPPSPYNANTSRQLVRARAYQQTSTASTASIHLQTMASSCEEEHLPSLASLVLTDDYRPSSPLSSSLRSENNGDEGERRGLTTKSYDVGLREEVRQEEELLERRDGYSGLYGPDLVRPSPAPSIDYAGEEALQEEVSALAEEALVDDLDRGKIGRAVGSILTDEGPVDDGVKRLVFGRCLRYLVRHGMAEGKARGLLGRWARHYGWLGTAAAVADAERAEPEEPVPYIAKILARDLARGREEDRQLREQERLQALRDRVEKLGSAE